LKKQREFKTEREALERKLAEAMTAHQAALVKAQDEVTAANVS